MTAAEGDEQLALLATAARRRGRGPSRRRAWPRPTRSPGSSSTSGWPTWTGSSTTACPTSMAEAARPGSGCGCGSPGARSAATSSSGGRRPSTSGRLTPIRRVVSAELGAAARRCSTLGRGGRRPLRRHAARRPAPGGAAAPRHRREVAPGRAGAAAAASARTPGPGRTTRPGRRSWTGSRPATRCGRPGPRCPGRTGPRRSPGRSARRASGRSRGAWSWCRTTATSTGSSARSASCSGAGPARPAHRRPGSGGALRRVAEGPARSGPGRRRDPSRGLRPGARPRAGRRAGTTATTCTPSRTRRTRTSARCSRCGADRDGAAALFGGFVRTAEVQRLVDRAGPARSAASRSQVRGPRPRVLLAGEDAELARDPAARTRAAAVPGLAHGPGGLEHGPVLVQVPRSGYLPGAGLPGLPRAGPLPACHGPLGIGEPRRAAASAAGAGGPTRRWACPACEGTRLRSSVVGARRTAEELGRAFPGVRSGPVAGSRPGRRPGHARPSSSRRPAPSRSPTAATPRRCCSTAGRCSAGPTCGRARRRCAAGPPPRPWSGRPPAGGVVVLAAPTGRAAGRGAACGGTRPGTPSAELAERVGLGFPPAVRVATRHRHPGGRRGTSLAVARLPGSPAGRASRSSARSPWATPSGPILRVRARSAGWPWPTRCARRRA